MEFFQDLGSLVERRWRDQNYDDEVFPELALGALAEADPSKHVDPWDIIRWLNKTAHLPEQRDVDGNFGNPPITLYNGPRFYIDVYYWLDGTTTIHQHSFCGAFQVLLGSSLLSQYIFEENRRINDYLRAGQISLRSVELLGEGDVREIPPGRQYIHSLFHLDRPSASIIIRTQQTIKGLPQYDYLKPYFARDPFFRSAAIVKRVQSASLLLSMKHPDADEMIGELLSCSDFQTAFPVLELLYDRLANDPIEKAFGITTGEERFDALLGIARRRHGELVDMILPVIDEVRRQNHIIHRRGQITGNDHRFFLALLLNVPERLKVLDLVRQRFPEKEPIDTITEWVEELANTRVAGSHEPNVAGIENFDEDYLFVLQCLLEGLTVDQTKKEFAQELPQEDAHSLEGKIEKLYSDIRNSMLFKAIFLDATLGAPAQRSLAV
jgi:hypothetical protein